jgi:hypothetical protein
MTRIPVLIDTDVDIDDWMAILYLSMHPNVDLRGITVTGVGACHLTPGTRNALNLLQLTGKPDVPVAKGTSAPLSYSNVFPDIDPRPDRCRLQRSASGKSKRAGGRKRRRLSSRDAHGLSHPHDHPRHRRRHEPRYAPS